MSYSKDLKSKPKDGCYFPLRFADVVKFVKSKELKEYSGDRIRVRLENTSKENAHGIPIAEFMPETEIALFSLPLSVPGNFGKRAANFALAKLAEVGVRKNNESSSKFSYYSSYLASDGIVNVIRKDVSRQRPKYRGSAKFSNAFKSKKRQTEETLLVSEKTPNNSLESDA